MLSKLLALLVSAFAAVIGELAIIWNYGLPSFSMMLGVFLVVAVWLGSGFFAATVAELFGHRVTRHFVLGLLLPYGYPIWLTNHITAVVRQQAADEKTQGEQKHEAQRSEIAARFSAIAAERAARRPRAALKEVAPPEPPAEPVAEPVAADPAAPSGPTLKEQIFDLPVNVEGERNGPFRIGTTNGIVLDVASIRSMNDDFFICVVAGSGKAVRIKYDNVTSFEISSAE
jgi:hypothetical protein